MDQIEAVDDRPVKQFKVARFDYSDPKNIGRPAFFDVETFIETVEMFITCDEVATAMHLINNMPGWYRDNMPERVVNLRNQLYRRFFTTLDYARDGCYMKEIASQPSETLKAGVLLERGAATYEVVKGINGDNRTPWIYELAPGNYWLPLMLREHGLQFTYCGRTLNIEMQRDASVYLASHWRNDPDMDQFKIFIAFELIEHLADPSEIFHHYVKAGNDFDVILLSTPKYTYGHGMPNWYENDLGHLRTYTPTEFLSFAKKHWPEHFWEIYHDPVMVLRGIKQR